MKALLLKNRKGFALYILGALITAVNGVLQSIALAGSFAAAAREREGLSFKAWSVRLQRYVSHLELLVSPDLFIVGGGVSRKSEKFLPRLTLRTPIVPAVLLNGAGIAGAAALAADPAADGVA